MDSPTRPPSPLDLPSIRQILTRATGTGWEAAYRQDVGALLGEIARLNAIINEPGECNSILKLRVERDAQRVRAEGAERGLLTFRYENHRGVTAVRRVRPLRFWFGQTEWYATPRWLLRGHDEDRGADRDFDVARVSFLTPNPAPVAKE